MHGGKTNNNVKKNNCLKKKKGKEKMKIIPTAQEHGVLEDDIDVDNEGLLHFDSRPRSDTNAFSTTVGGG